MVAVGAGDSKSKLIVVITQSLWLLPVGGGGVVTHTLNVVAVKEGFAELKYNLSLYVTPIFKDVAKITLLMLQYICVNAPQSEPSYKTMATGCGVPTKLERATVCEVAVAVNWYHISAVVLTVQVLPSGDTVAAENDAVDVAVHAVPEFTVSVVALAQLSFTGATSAAALKDGFATKNIKKRKSVIFFIYCVGLATKIMLKTYTKQNTLP
jgi:hypothetical protein